MNIRVALLVAVSALAACGGSAAPSDASDVPDVGVVDFAPAADDLAGRDLSGVDLAPAVDLRSCVATASTDVTCNGIDDDCDGQTDEDYVPDSSCFGVGLCAAGNASSTCVAGVTTACKSGIAGAVSESICNGVDDDCDGSIDEDYVPDTSCYKQGACAAGNAPSACTAGVVKACATGSPTSVAETTCNGIDDDCDGLIDEDYLVVTSCFKDGACALGNAGSSCMSGVEISCLPGAPSGLSEALCNGLDDDCDGLVDEDYVADTSCFGGGACAAGNVASSCTKGIVTACASGLGTGVSEAVCNGVDDDCDGTTDEDYARDASCFNQCATGNVASACTAGTETACAAAPLTGIGEDVCNGVDDDCDGQIDEDYVSDTSCIYDSSGVGSTCSNGVETPCNDGCVPTAGNNYCADLSSSAISGQGWDGAGQLPYAPTTTLAFHIQARDTNGNDITVGGIPFTVNVHISQYSQFFDVAGDVTDNGDGTYDVSYSVSVGGSFEVDISVSAYGQLVNENSTSFYEKK